MQNTTSPNGAGAAPPHINLIDDEGNLVEFGNPMEGIDLPEDTPGFMEVWNSREGQPARRGSHQAYVSDCEEQQPSVSPPEPSKIILRTENNLMTGKKRNPKGSKEPQQHQRQAPTRTSPRFANQHNPQSQAPQQQQQYQQHLAPTPPPQQPMHHHPQNQYQAPAPLPRDPQAPIPSHFLKPHEIYDPRPRQGETEAAAIVRSACIPKLLYLNGLKRAAEERGDVDAAHELVGRLKLAVNEEETDAYGRRDRNGQSC